MKPSSLGGHQPAVTGDHAIVPVDDDRVDEAELPQRGPQLHDLVRGMGTGIVDIRDQFVDRDQPHVRGSGFAHGLSFPGVQKTLHQIIIGACAAIIDGAVFLYNLINLVPQLVDLLEVLLGHRNEGEAIAPPVVGCLARKPYSEMACSHCIQRATLMAYWSMSCLDTSFSHLRCLSHS